MSRWQDSGCWASAWGHMLASDQITTQWGLDSMATTNYLKECLCQHTELTKSLYGKVQRLDKIERDVQELAREERFSYDIIRAIRNHDHWDADMFGYWPSKEEFATASRCKDWSALRRAHTDPEALPKREEGALIAKLLTVFRRQIEPVSVLLRFWCPKHYGIISPPVDAALGMALTRQPAERYKKYLRCLRKLRDEREFGTAAEVDMALWTLQEGVVYARLRGVLAPEEFNELRKQFEGDTALANLRIANLTRQVFQRDGMPPIRLAEAILSIESSDKQYAAWIAGIEFEHLVRQWLQADPDKELFSIIESAPEKCQDALHMARKIRPRQQNLWVSSGSGRSPSV